MELPSTQEFMIKVAAQLTRHGLKMRHLSDKTGFTQASLSDAKNGRTNFTFEKANVISKALKEMIDEQ